MPIMNKALKNKKLIKFIHIFKINTVFYNFIFHSTIFFNFGGTCTTYCELHKAKFVYFDFDNNKIFKMTKIRAIKIILFCYVFRNVYKGCWNFLSSTKQIPKKNF